MKTRYGYYYDWNRSTKWQYAAIAHAAIAAPLVVELRWSAVDKHCCTTDSRWLFSRAAAGSPSGGQSVIGGTVERASFQECVPTYRPRVPCRSTAC